MRSFQVQQAIINQQAFKNWYGQIGPLFLINTFVMQLSVLSETKSANN